MVQIFQCSALRADSIHEVKSFSMPGKRKIYIYIKTGVFFHHMPNISNLSKVAPFQLFCGCLVCGKTFPVFSTYGVLGMKLQVLFEYDLLSARFYLCIHYG